MTVGDRLRATAGSRLRGYRARKLADRDLDDFETEQRSLVRACEEAEQALEFAGPHEVDARRAAYLELVVLGRERLDAACDDRAAELGPDAQLYRDAFHRGVLRRLSRFAPEIDQP